MCLAIPGQILNMVDDANRIAKVTVAGVQRNVNVGLLDGTAGGVIPGDWVLIHVGSAARSVGLTLQGDPRSTTRALE